MAGDMSIGCAALKRSSKHVPSGELAKDKENGDGGLTKVPPVAPQNMRGGLRVYKIVILGDGGVGKSGESGSGSDFF